MPFFHILALGRVPTTLCALATGGGFAPRPEPRLPAGVSATEINPPRINVWCLPHRRTRPYIHILPPSAHLRAVFSFAELLRAGPPSFHLADRLRRDCLIPPRGPPELVPVIPLESVFFVCLRIPAVRRFPHGSAAPCEAQKISASHVFTFQKIPKCLSIRLRRERVRPVPRILVDGSGHRLEGLAARVRNRCRESRAASLAKPRAAARRLRRSSQIAPSSRLRRDNLACGADRIGGTVWCFALPRERLGLERVELSSARSSKFREIRHVNIPGSFPHIASRIAKPRWLSERAAARDFSATTSRRLSVRRSSPANLAPQF